MCVLVTYYRCMSIHIHTSLVCYEFYLYIQVYTFYLYIRVYTEYSDILRSRIQTLCALSFHLQKSPSSPCVLTSKDPEYTLCVHQVSTSNFGGGNLMHTKFVFWIFTSTIGSGNFQNWRWKLDVERALSTPPAVF